MLAISSGLAPSSPCPAGAPAGPPFVVVVQRVDGTRTAYRSGDLAGGGREALARYLAAMAYQQADRDAATTVGYVLQCSPPKPDDVLPLPAPLVALRSTHGSGMLCAYPLFDPAGTEPLVPRDYAHVPLTPAALAAIGADLATASFETKPPPRCAASSRQLVLRLQTPGSHSADGDLVELTGECLDNLRLPGHALWWRPGPAARAALVGLLPAG